MLVGRLVVIKIVSNVYALVLESALLQRKESTIVMAFYDSFVFDTHEVTRMVLPKVLQNFNFYLLAKGTEPKKILPFFRVTYITGRD